MEHGIDVLEAWTRIESAVRALGTEEVSLEKAAGRWLVERVRVDRDTPAFDRAAMDGYAVQEADLLHAGPDAPVRLEVVGEVTPGIEHTGPARPGTALRIMTGAPVPTGWDSVVPVEQTSGFEVSQVDVYARPRLGQHIAPKASERRCGEELFGGARRLSEADVGVLAMVGASRVTVGRRARVAVLATGNEIVPHGRKPGPAEVRNSNTPLLGALCAPHASEVVVFDAVRDEAEELDQAVRRGLGFDTFLISGGISMGAYDLVGEALEKAGLRFGFRRVLLQPGKPTGFATHDRGVVLALPGNPVSTLTTFRLFGTLVLRLQEGERRARPVWARAHADFEWTRRHAKWLFVPGVTRDQGRVVERVPYAGSGDLMALARADCQIVLPPELSRVGVGDPVLIWPFAGPGVRP